MASRAIARVTISFGMAHIAVKIYLAAAANQISFAMINAKTRNRVGQKLVDKITGDEVDRSDLLKGYEYAKDQFVCFTESEIENLQAAKKDTLEISEFIPANQIDPLHVEKVYYTGPDKGMDKGYKFLHELLKKHDRAAIGTWVSRGKEHLVAIRAYQHGLIMQQLFYNTEIRSFDNTCAENITISPVEFAMGKVLMDTLSRDTFDKSKYSDRFVDKVTAAIQTKLDGGSITEVVTTTQNTGMADALRASLLAMGVPESQVQSMLTNAESEAAKVKSPEPALAKPAASKTKRTRKAAKAS